MLLLFVALVFLQANASETTQKIDPLPTFPDGMSVIGVYEPNTQLLKECTSTDVVKLHECDGFISGVVQATGLITAFFPKGPIALPIPKDYNEMVLEPRQIVIDYINALPKSRMSEPAAYSVYAALVARYPYKGSHERDIPLVIK